MRLSLLGVSLTGLLAAAPVAQAAPGGVEILNAGSNWRWHVTLRPPVMTDDEGGGPVAMARGRWIDGLASDPPPADWAAADLDDAHWPRSKLTWLAELARKRFSGAMLSVRGKFTVTDPSAVGDLTLTVRYTGGAVVHLNGREVARAHLPAGKLAPDTPATAYGREAYFGADGKVIPGDYHRGVSPPAKRRDYNARVAARTRTLGPVKLPAKLLRKGVNVLAVRIHRSPYHPVALTWYTRNRRMVPAWRTLNVRGISLRATGTGVMANVARPAGLRVWNQDRNDRVTAVDWGDPNDALKPVRIVAARNSTYCGQVVAGSTEAIRGLTATAGPIKAVKGGAVLPAGGVDVLYGRMDWPARHYPTWCDGLQREPIAEVKLDRRYRSAIVPIIVRIRVPPGAAPGEYRGTMTISADGARPVKVPVEVSVADWQVPDPHNYRTYIGIYQSPTSLAMQYGVTEWSERHWRLMDRSFALLARAGNKLVNVMASENTQFGNDEGMIYWIRKPDGSYDHDFSVFDRYMKLALKHCRSLDFVAVHLWHSGGWQTRAADQTNTVTVIDKATGKRSSLQVPVFGTDESKEFWKPVLDGVRERLAKLGLADAMCLGILSDGTAPPPVFKAFDEIVPGGAKWMRGLHHQLYVMKPYRLRGGGKVVLHEFCYGLGLPEVTGGKPFPPIWKYRGRPGVAYHRIAGHENAATLIWYRTFPEQSLYRNTGGVGRICLDFWPVLKRREGRRGREWIYNRFPFSSCAQRRPSLQKMTWPGPRGAETTVRFEAFCEGAQEAEAAIVVSDALDNYPDVLGEALAARCRKVLVDRLNFCRFWDQMQWARSYFHMHHYGWQDLTKRLYDCAAEVTKELKE